MQRKEALLMEVEDLFGQVLREYELANITVINDRGYPGDKEEFETELNQRCESFDKLIHEFRSLDEMNG